MQLHNSCLLLAAVLLSLHQLLPQISNLHWHSQHHRVPAKAKLSLCRLLLQASNLQWQLQHHKLAGHSAVEPIPRARSWVNAVTKKNIR